MKFSESPSANKLDEILVFVHVPKAAGSTLRAILDQQYSEQAVYRCDMHLYPSAFDDFRNMPAEQAANIRCLIGHLPYGVHEYLPRSARYVTLLRNPIDRFLSKYKYLCNNDWVADQILVEKKQIETLEAFIELQIQRNAMNFQTRQISGLGGPQNAFPPFAEPVTPKTLETAKKNLRDKFEVVGLQDQFNASLLLMKHIFGWGSVYYHKQNVTSRPVPRTKISPRTRDLIEQHNQLDMQLFEYAQELFVDQVKAYGPDFERDLREFEKNNDRFVVRDTIWQKARMFKWKAEGFVTRCLGGQGSGS